MPFDWKQYVEWARAAQSAASGAGYREAILRIALSRAYYGAFCFARNYARDLLGFKVGNDADDHGRLRHYLKGKRRHAVSNRLDRLRQWRNACDYLDELGFDPQKALAAALNEADYIFSALVPLKKP